MRKNHLMSFLAKAVLGLSLLCGFTAQEVYAAQAASQPQAVRNITGQIVDEAGVPVIGAAVIVNGTTNKGTTTDVNGNFALDVPAGAVLTVSCIGYVNQEITVGDRATLKIVLKEDTTLLDEVVLIGYGSQKKINLSASVTTVNMEEVLGDRPVANTVTALQGAIPGLNIVAKSSSTAKAGNQSNTISMRGTTTFSDDDGMSEALAIAPLVLIDNVPGDLYAINPNDIATVTVLKDASSTAIYGARAAAGVILITTKRPDKAQKPTVTLNATYGVTDLSTRPHQVDLERYIEVIEERNVGEWVSGQSINDWKTYLAAYKAGKDMSSYGTMYDGGVLVASKDNKTYFLQDRDLYKDMWPGGKQTNLDASVAGATDRVRYRMSANYFNEDGITYGDKDTYVRKTASAYISADITNWLTQDLDIYYSNATSRSPVYKSDWADAMDADKTPQGLAYVPDTVAPNGKGWYTANNAVDASSVETTVNSKPRIFSKTTLKPIEGLSVVLEYTYDGSTTNLDSYKPTAVLWTAEQKDQWLTKANQDIETVQNIQQVRKTLDAYATYAFNFGKNNFSVMAGYDQESWDYLNYKATAKAMGSDLIPSLSNATGDKTLSESHVDYATRSGFFRFDYNYDEKYILQVNGRYDGSSKFPKGKRFGFFPSFSVAWNIAKEDFMKDATWLNLLKPRYSYGKVGNENALGDSYSNAVYYGYLATMDLSTTNTSWRSGTNEGYNSIQSVPDLVSSDYTWEVITTSNFGIDLAAFKNRLTFTGELYTRTTDQILAAGGTAPAILGAAMPIRNVGQLKTKGFEVSVGWKNNIGKDWRYAVSANLFDYVTKCTKIDNNPTGDYSHLYVGAIVGDQWGYVVDGFYTVDDFSDLNTWKIKEGVPENQNMYGLSIGQSRPGDWKFVNFNDHQTQYGDRADDVNRINEGQGTYLEPGDTKIIANNLPRFNYGANLSVGWKNLDLSVMLQGVGKWSRTMNKQQWLIHTTAKKTQQYRAIFANTVEEGWYWQPKSLDPNSPDYMVAKYPNAYLPRLYNETGATSSPNDKENTRLVRSRAYTRLKNVTLSYNLPKSWLNAVNIANAKVFVSSENVFMLNNDYYRYGGMDPEVDSQNIPLNRTTSFGLNITF